MMFVLEEHKEIDLKQDIIPDFKNVRPADKTRLLLEVCERKYRFGQIEFFKGLPRFMWLNFYEKMEKRVFIKGDIIFERGAPSSHFYVIKSGRVRFMMNQDDFKSYPFTEISQWFGEFELFEETTRRWTAVAKNKVILY
jgi:signal-transduction protein with cAMP-binding, CBS, and nucleotidyltransferase domain